MKSTEHQTADEQAFYIVFELDDALPLQEAEKQLLNEMASELYKDMLWLNEKE